MNLPHTVQKIAPASADLTTCDQEPIHLIGGVQPQGCVLVMKTSNWTIVQASENTDAILGETASQLLGRSLMDFLMTPFKMRLEKQFHASLLAKEVKPLKLSFSGPTGERSLTALVHAIEGDLLAVLELEAESEQIALLSFIDFYDEFAGAVSRLQQTQSVQALCEAAIQEVKSITQFDRVWVHQVVEDGHLQIIAEQCRVDQKPLLGLYFPASDIPKQARRLYVLNRLRLISDVNAKDCALIPALNPLTHAPLDLSLSFLRAVSPVHLEYLGNIGVKASMSISIVKNGELWGLISCHHNEPRQISYQSRAACEFLGRIVSLQIPLLESKAEAEAELRLRVHLSEIQKILTVRDTGQLLDLFRQKSEHLLALAGADGAAVCIRDHQPLLLGKTPPVDLVKGLVPFVMIQANQKLFVTEELSQILPSTKNLIHSASGLLAVSLSKHEPFVILWFRGEQVQTIPWGGDPNKAVLKSNDGVRLSPRKSFEKWSEIRHGKSLPWLSSERKMVEEFRLSFMALVIERAQELSKLNEELERSNVELDSFAYVASHDLKEPLRGIHTYSTFLIEDYAHLLDENGQKKLGRMITMTERMNALIESLLIFSRIGRTELELQPVNLDELVQEAVDTLHARLSSTGTHVEVVGSLPSIPCDRIRILEVFHNLISNAVKYNDRDEKRIQIACTTEILESGQTERVISIRDNGIGIDPNHKSLIFQIFKRLHTQEKYGGGSGAGLTIVKKIIERHGGRIWLESKQGEGSTFFFTLGKPTR